MTAEARNEQYYGESREPNDISARLGNLRASIGVDEQRLSQYRDFRNGITPFPQNLTFDLFCRYTSAKPLERIGGNAICDFCTLGIDPSYVNRCFSSEKFLKATLDGAKVIDMHKCGVSPDSLPMLSQYLEHNSEWWRKLEFIGYPYVGSFVRFIRENPNASIRVGKYDVPLTRGGNRFGLYVGLINTAKRARLDMESVPWEMVIESYQRTVDAYIEKWKRPVDRVFLVGAKDRDPVGGAYRHLDAFKYVYENTAGAVTEFKEWTGIDKDSIVPDIERYVRQHPGQKVVVHIGLHGTAAWNTRFDNGNLSKSDMERLRRLSLGHDLVLVVNSCYWALKFSDETPAGNIVFTSRTETASHYGFDQKFIEAYHYRSGSKQRNGDFLWTGGVSFEEANLYAFLNQGAWDMGIAFRSAGETLRLD